MLTCPRCNKPLADDSTVCDACGAPIVQTPNSAVCPNCGNPAPADAMFCQRCGTPLPVQPQQPQQPSTEPVVPPTEPVAPPTEPVAPPEKKKRKKWIIAGAIALGAILIAAIIIIICIFSGSKKNYTMYIKDNELFFNTLSDKKPWQVTTNLLIDDSDEDDVDLINLSFYFFMQMSEDGKIMVFPDRISTEDETMSLYYCYVDKPNKEPVKIGSNISFYFLSKDGKNVTYIKNEDSTIYHYNLKDNTTEKIGSDVSLSGVSPDGKKILYYNDEYSLYIYNVGGDKEKIDSEVSRIVYFTEDLGTVYYMKDDILYKKVQDKDKERIASDVTSVLKVYESGEIYYIKSSDSNQTLLDYIEDDMKASDAAITIPKTPSRSDYDTYNQYSIAYDKYLEDYDKYQEKLERDRLRESLAETPFSLSGKRLCYYNGNKTETVTDYYIGSDVSADVPVMVIRAYDKSSAKKVKFSEITSIYNVESLIRASAEYYVTIGASISLIEQTEATSFRINDSGDTIYYIDDVPEGKNEGDLYRIQIKNGKAGKSELYDSDVYYYGLSFVSNDKFMYFKDVSEDGYSERKGELYINKTRIDYDVELYKVTYVEESDKLIYFTDWDSSKEYGTLKIYENEKAKKISDDVTDVSLSSTGEILYIYDYSTTYEKGDLYRYKDGKTKRIDIDVMGIIPTYKVDVYDFFFNI